MHSFNLKKFSNSQIDYSPIEVREYEQEAIDIGAATSKSIAIWRGDWPTGYLNPPENIYERGNTVKESLRNLFDRLKRYPDISEIVNQTREKIEAQIGPLEMDIES